MKHHLVKTISVVTFLLMYGFLHPGGYNYADEQKPPQSTDETLQATIQQQEETIKLLQAEIKKQKDEIDQLSGEKTPPDPVAEALLESWGCGSKRSIQVNEGLVKVYFGDVNDVVHFFDTGAEKHAYRDLAVFLEKANLKKGTIEYYSNKKLFSITGGLTDAKTRQYF